MTAYDRDTIHAQLQAAMVDGDDLASIRLRRMLADLDAREAVAGWLVVPLPDLWDDGPACIAMPEPRR